MRLTFLITLVTILAIGLIITQLIIFEWTEGWLWHALHALLFMVSIAITVVHIFIVLQFLIPISM